MRLHYIFVLLMCLFAVPAAAQEHSIPYEIALQRIEAARVSGATELDLRGLGLTELPPELWELMQLQALDMSVNLLGTLPAEIGQLTNLQKLVVSSTSLTALPPEIGHLTQLKHLSADNNHLTTLPPTIGSLIHLEKLTLSINELSHLPSEIGQLERLCWLDLHINPLSDLPFEMGNTLTPSAACPEPHLVLYENYVVVDLKEVTPIETQAILAYLRQQGWYHARHMMLSALGGVGVIAGVILLARWRYRRLRKPKAKRGDAA